MQLTIETTASETIIHLPNSVKFEFLQQMLDYLAVKETLSRSQADEQAIDELAEEAQSNWWKANKARWIK
jgi:predicted transcriptional regulator